MLYSVAEYLEPLGPLLKGTIRFSGSSTCPGDNCRILGEREMLSTCSVDIFEDGLISFQIGAPIKKGSYVEHYIYQLLRTIELENSVELNMFLDYFDSSLNEHLKISNSHPHILFIQSNEEIKDFS